MFFKGILNPFTRLFTYYFEIISDFLMVSVLGELHSLVNQSELVTLVRLML